MLLLHEVLILDACEHLCRGRCVFRYSGQTSVYAEKEYSYEDEMSPPEDAHPKKVLGYGLLIPKCGFSWDDAV